MSWLSSHKRSRGRVLVLAPTGKAVDVAVREGAGGSGYTITKALHMLRNDTLALTRWTLVIVDEVGMVGTDELRRLLTATTAAGTKTVLVGDAHQLASVKARGGMFARRTGLESRLRNPANPIPLAPSNLRTDLGTKLREAGENERDMS